MEVESGQNWVGIADNRTSNYTASNLHLGLQNSSPPVGLWHDGQAKEVTQLEDLRLSQEKAYRDFATAVQVLILIGSLLGNATVLWCTCCTNVFKSVTSRFVRNLACSGICAGLVCVPFDLALSASPRCCLWLHTLLFCKAIKFLHKLFCSVTVLSFAAIALDRYYSVLYPLERKISDARSRDLVIYIWVHSVVASVPVFAVTNVTDIYATSSCSAGHSLGHVVYAVTYNVTTVILPLAAVFMAMALIRRALSASQKKKVIIAALRTPQNSISIPYVSQREAELHATLLSVVLAFSLCSAPYGALVVWRAVLGVAEVAPVLRLTAVWLPKVSLLTNPLLFLTVNRSVRRCLLDGLARLHRRYSRRNAVGSGGLGDVGGALGGEGAAARSGSQLLEMFNIGQQQIFKPSEEEEEEEEDENEVPSAGSTTFPPKEEEEVEVMVGGGRTRAVVGKELTPLPSGEARRETGPLPSKPSPLHGCAYSASQVAPAMPLDPEDATQFGFGPFELPPQWLPETRSSKKRLLPPLGNTPEELIQTKQPRTRPERRISRNNKVSSFPTVDP